MAVCVMAFLVIGHNDSFYLGAPRVEGASSLTESQIISASGLAGTHVFAADPGVAAERIGLLPGVVSASVYLEWPNIVNIQIEEDAAIATWEQAGERFWIYEDGTLLPAGLSAKSGLHIISEIEEPVGEQLFIPIEVIEGARQLQEIRPNINQLYYKPGSGLSYQDGRGWKVYFGVGQDMNQKIVVYETIIEHLTSRGVKPVYISVANQLKPFYLPG